MSIRHGKVAKVNINEGSYHTLLAITTNGVMKYCYKQALLLFVLKKKMPIKLPEVVEKVYISEVKQCIKINNPCTFQT